METFPQTLADVTATVCVTGRHVFGKFCLLSLRGRGQIKWFVWGRIPTELIIPIKHRCCRSVFETEPGAGSNPQVGKTAAEGVLPLNFHEKYCNMHHLEAVLWEKLLSKTPTHPSHHSTSIWNKRAIIKSQYMTSHIIIRTLSRTGKEGVWCFLGGCGMQILV